MARRKMTIEEFSAEERRRRDAKIMSLRAQHEAHERAHESVLGSPRYQKLRAKGGSISAEESARISSIAPMSNEQRGELELEEILRDLPSMFVAYAKVHGPSKHESRPQSVTLTTWPGQVIAEGVAGNIYKSPGFGGSIRRRQIVAKLRGVTYVGIWSFDSADAVRMRRRG